MNSWMMAKPLGILSRSPKNTTSMIFTLIPNLLLCGLHPQEVVIILLGILVKRYLKIF
jgi:hypothetical protein